MDQLFTGLNDRQQEAVKVLGGPLLVLAGAGSGKTKVLTHRIANLIANGVSPSEILAVTFTNKAAREMEGRIEKLLSTMEGEVTSPRLPGGSFSAHKPALGTFHATCVRILRADIEALEVGFNSNFVIFDTDDAQKLMKMIMKDKHIDEKEIKIKAVMAHISGAKNTLVTPIKYQEEVEENRFTSAVKTLYPEYQQRLRDHNALDFDDLLQKVVELFEQCPQVLKKYRSRWSHLLVDEYQDTNFAQYRFVRLLADDHKNLCVVGDDHQSIYSFRGADFRNILDFEKDFPEAQIVKLEQNYRSTSNILENANCLIRHNETGKEKNLWTENESGDPVAISEVYDEKDEGRFISEQIRDLREAGAASYSDFAVLYRMNAQSRAIEESLMKNQIPYQIVGGTRFFDRREIKDVIAYLRLIFNPRDDVSFLRIINVPGRKLGQATIDVLRKYAEHYTMSLFEVLSAIDEIDELPAAKKQVLKDFKALIDGMRGMIPTNDGSTQNPSQSPLEKGRSEAVPISILLDKLIERIDFFKYLEDGTNEGEERINNVKELFSVATKYDSAENPLAAFLEGVALISDLDNHDSSSDSVTLMTIHAAKGLEFPTVFLPGWEEGIFPGSSSQFSGEAMEEERRLGYVAITRAEKKCFITHARQRMLFGRTEYSGASKFLSELNDECVERTSFSGVGGAAGYYSSSRGNSRISAPSAGTGKDLFYQPKTKQEAIFGVASNETEFSVGNRIRHAEFGEGTVIQISGDVLTVAFSGKGVKKIVASVAPISMIN